MGGEWLTPHRDLAPFLPQAVGLPSAVGSSWFVVLGGRGPPAHTHRTGLARGGAAACFEGLPGKVRWLQEKGEGRRGGFGFQWGSRQPCRALSAAGGKKEPRGSSCMGLPTASVQEQLHPTGGEFGEDWGQCERWVLPSAAVQGCSAPG